MKGENYNCYRCDVELDNNNSSYEHIILNACGGRLKSNRLLCKKCNSDFGNSFDNTMAIQTNELANLLMVKRERGEPQPIKGKTSDGTTYKMMANGDIKKAHPKVDVKREGNNVRLTINASDEDQYKQILKDIKKKNPGLDIDHALHVANRSEYYLNEPISLQMTMGGDDVFRSLTKTAINYYIHVGGESTYIKHLIPYLNGNISLGNVWFHYPDEKIYQPKDDEVSHVLRIIGDPEKKILYAYIELFNAHNYIVLLNEWYDGDAVDGTYAYHLINDNEINITTNLDYSREHVLNLFSQKDAHSHVKINDCLNRSFKIADAIQTKFHLNKKINSAVHSALNKYPAGTIFSNEVIADLQREVQTQVVPFIAQQLRKRKNQ